MEYIRTSNIFLNQKNNSVSALLSSFEGVVGGRAVMLCVLSVQEQYARDQEMMQRRYAEEEAAAKRAGDAKRHMVGTFS